VTFSRLVGQGFTPPDATRGLVLLHDFTIGFCVEEQAVSQAVAAGDERYSPGRRAEMIGAENAPLAVEAGAVIFGDPAAGLLSSWSWCWILSHGCARRGDRREPGNGMLDGLASGGEPWRTSG